MRRQIRQLVESVEFQNTVVFVIIFCSIVLGIETFFYKKLVLFEAVDLIFTLFFVVEIILRLLAAKSLSSFFHICTIRIKKKQKRNRTVNKLQFLFEEKGFWNVFDTTIVVLSVIGLMSHWVEHPEFLVVSRLFRVSRIFRLLEISSELRNVEKKIITIIPTVFSFALLLGILIYIYSIIGIYLFGHHAFEKADFSDLPAAALTLFQLMTLDGWSEIMNDVAALEYDNWFYKGYFISFVILTAIISFNVFVAVLTTQVHDRMQEEAKNAEKKLRNTIESDIEEAEEEVLKSMEMMLSEIRDLKAEVKSLKNG
ncbi:ion transporter [Fulvivirga lutea]|uniref:Ion transporter n=1 Tax=Fulvivirga lutea TaxID=2810512 RepID=A0A974WKI5_9BACT|nr:ion transporter [Fulvivirga lutea]QSE98867.1 ion transporter [Fulvivirga lutea]